MGEAVGKIVSLLIWLFGLLAVLQVLGLGSVAGPINELLNNIMDFIPNLVGAGLIFFIGVMVAGIVRDIVTTTLQTVDFDKWANKGGVDTMTGNATISKTIGLIVYVLIIIPVSILALEALNLESVSEPASNMLRMILGAIPNIIAAALLLGIGYLVSRFLVQVLKEVLPGLGVDRSLESAGVLPAGTTPSAVIARIVQIAIIIAFAIMATRALNFPEITLMLSEILALGGQVVFGAVVIGFGFLIANVLARIVAGDAGSSTAATVIRWATMILFTFMGLTFMGVGEEIVQLAFGSLVIGGAVAAALAFGIGGRDWAGRKLEEWDGRTGTGAGKDNDPLPPGA